MSDESKKRPTQNLGPVDAELHRLLKALAATRSKSLRQLLEDHLGPIAGWTPPQQVEVLAAQ